MDTTNASLGESADNWIFVAESLAVNCENPENGSENKENLSEESDTESISIIGECEPEETIELFTDRTGLLLDSNINIDHDTKPTNVLPKCDEDHPHMETEIGSDIKMELNDASLKTYVHKNNKSLNTMLNIILLGSILTAAGLALGHMWGVQDDCALHTNTSASEVLYTLHKLETENKFLKNKLMEMEKTRVRTVTVDFPKQKLQQLRALHSINDQHADANMVTEKDKWKHIDDPTAISQMRKPINHEEFDHQIHLLKSIYDDNKYWLDKEIIHRLQRQDEILKQTHSMVVDDGRIIPLEKKLNMVNSKKVSIIANQNIRKMKKPINTIKNSRLASSFVGPLSYEEYAQQHTHKKENFNISKLQAAKTSIDKKISNDRISMKTVTHEETQKDIRPKKIVYSDALKNLKEKRHNKQFVTSVDKDNIEINQQVNSSEDRSFSKDYKIAKEHLKGDSKEKHKRKLNSDNKEIKNKKFKSYNVDDDTLIKDLRYAGQKHKYESKKYYKPKLNKKQKNGKKYQQGDVNRVFLNSNDGNSNGALNEQSVYSDRNNPSQKRQMRNYLNKQTNDVTLNLDSENLPVQLDESEFNSYNTQPTRKSKEYFRRTRSSSEDWYSKLANGRKEYRDNKQLAGLSLRNKAQWYFERMNDREQYRKQLKNVTKNVRNSESLKNNMNYKTKQ